MIVPDINILLYAHMRSAQRHNAAKAWWQSAVGGIEPIGFSWMTILGFVRIATNRRIYDPPLTLPEAEALVTGWLALPHVSLLEPSRDHSKAVFELLNAVGSAANWTTDAHIAALALEWDATVYSFDGDFGRWPQVKWVNPLA